MPHCNPKSWTILVKRLSFMSSFSIVIFSSRSLSSRLFKCPSLQKFLGQNLLAKICVILVLGKPGYLLITRGVAEVMSPMSSFLSIQFLEAVTITTHDCMTAILAQLSLLSRILEALTAAQSALALCYQDQTLHQIIFM